MKRLFLVTLLMMLYVCLHAQHKHKRDVQDVSELTIINNHLLSALDTIITMKSKITDEIYKDGHLFTMWFGLDSIRKDMVIIWSEGDRISGANHDLGIFDYKEHSFLVRGFSLDTTIFSESAAKRKFDFTPQPISWLNDEGEIVLATQNENKYCNWVYRYHNMAFKLLAFGVYDESVPSFDRIDEEYQLEANTQSQELILPGKTWEDL